MVKGSKEADEEEDFRGDEEDYSISKAFLDRGCMVTLEGTFSDDVSSSLEHSKEKKGCAEEKKGGGFVVESGCEARGY